MKPVIATVGMFDGVHLGHQLLLDYLKNRAIEKSETTCVITFPRHPLSVVAPEREPKLITLPEEKIRLLTEFGIEKCTCVEFTEKMRQYTPLEFMLYMKKELNVNELVMGFNNSFGKDRNRDFNYFSQIGKKCGIEVTQTPEFDMNGNRVSSTDIRNSLMNKRLEHANQLLGREFELTGTVVPGNQLGHTLGFPTANISPASIHKLIPATGVYVCEAILSDKLPPRPAMVNIGVRPTVSNNPAQVTIEAHISDFNDNIYGQELTLRFIKFLRHEIKFSSINELKKQLKIDLNNSIYYFKQYRK